MAEEKDTTQKDLERGVDLLIEQMPDYVAQLIDEIAAQGSIPRWQLIGGILFEAYNNGYLSAYTLDPAWKDGFRPNETICKHCKKVFQPVRIGQIYCSNDCGLGLTPLEELAKEIVEDIHTKSKEETPKNARLNNILADLASKSKSSVNNHKSKMAKTNASESGWTDQPLPAA